MDKTETALSLELKRTVINFERQSSRTLVHAEGNASAFDVTLTANPWSFYDKHFSDMCAEIKPEPIDTDVETAEAAVRSALVTTLTVSGRKLESISVLNGDFKIRLQPKVSQCRVCAGPLTDRPLPFGDKTYGRAPTNPDFRKSAFCRNADCPRYGLLVVNLKA